MQAAFLDFDTLGSDDIDIADLKTELPGIKLYSHTSVDQVAERLPDVEVVIVNKVVLDAETLKISSSQCLVAFHISKNPAQRFGIALISAALGFITLFAVPAGRVAITNSINFADLEACSRTPQRHWRLGLSPPPYHAHEAAPPPASPGTM